MSNDSSYQVRENALFAIQGIIETNNGIFTTSEALKIGLEHIADSYHEARLSAATILAVICQLEIKNVKLNSSF